MLNRSFEAIMQFDAALREQKVPDLRALFKDPIQGSREERFHVYHAGFKIRARMAMEEVFEACSRLMPKNQWKLVMDKLAELKPASSFWLYDLHSQVLATMRGLEIDPSWIKLAELEQKVFKSFNAKKLRHRIDFNRLSEIKLHTRFFKQTSTELFESDIQVAHAWIHRKDSHAQNDFAKGQERSVIFRKEGTVYVRVLSEIEYKTLQMIMDGQTLQSALETHAENVTPEALMEWMHAWIGSELFYDFSSVKDLQKDLSASLHL